VMPGAKWLVIGSVHGQFKTFKQNVYMDHSALGKHDPASNHTT
jgi:hypothetical protein